MECDYRSIPGSKDPTRPYPMGRDQKDKPEWIVESTVPINYQLTCFIMYFGIGVQWSTLSVELRDSNCK